MPRWRGQRNERRYGHYHVLMLPCTRGGNRCPSPVLPEWQEVNGDFEIHNLGGLSPDPVLVTWPGGVVCTVFTRGWRGIAEPNQDVQNQVGIFGALTASRKVRWRGHTGPYLSAKWHENVDTVADVSLPWFMASQANALRLGPPAHKTARFKRAGESLGLSMNSVPDLIREVMRGFSYRSLIAFESNSGLSLQTLADIIGIPERTLARRKASGRLAPEESERLLRLSSIFEKAVELFEGDVSGAVNWLTTPKRALEGQTPLQYARTEVGAREVENLIGRLEHGVFS
jgi:putative toxin-antitoxin system antitoxin component (TIGR02293 family)